MASPLGIGACSILLVLIYKFIIIPAFVSPLSKIPKAHPTASILPLWIWWKRRAGTETRSIFQLHCQLGPVVRLGPSELSVNSLDGLRAIYLGGFERDRWYCAFENYSVPNLISMTENKPHSLQKRLISNIYSKSVLHNSAEMQQLSRIVLLGRFLPMVHAYGSKGAAVNVLEMAQSVAMDMISGYIFGSRNGTNFLQDVAYRTRWFQAYDVFKSQSPRDRAGGETEQSCVAMCEAAEAFLNQTGEKANQAENTRPVVYEQLSRRLDISNKGIAPKSKIFAVASELLDHLIAGHESTGITLTYMMYELSLRPRLQSRLREALLSLSPPLFIHPTTDPNDPETQPRLNAGSLRAIDSVPLLDAILQETLRLHQAVPAPQPRVTPYSSPPVRIEGHANIPGGVRVSSNAYTLHRNPEVFPNPQAWIPERWMDADQARRREMERWFWAFGSGGRMCLGSNFAIQSIKMIVAAIYTNCETSVVDDAGIEQADAYVAGPVGNKLVLAFHRV